MNDKHIIQAVLSGKYSINEPEWQDVSLDAKDLVKQLLTYDPVKRPSALEAYNHPWIKKMASGDRVNKDVAIRTLQNL
jgi:serine/threonine protein kinase